MQRIEKKISHNFDTLSLWPYHIVWQPMFAFSLPFMRFDSRHLRDFGWCPYYAARRLIHAASVVVLNYQHLGFKEFESLNLVHPTSSIQKQDLLFFSQLCTCRWIAQVCAGSKSVAGFLPGRCSKLARGFPPPRLGDKKVMETRG